MAKNVLIEENGMILSEDRAELIGCTKNLPRNVVIPDGVKVIDKFAFNRAEEMESVKIPDSVKVIEDSTFQNCTWLKEVDFGTGVESIGISAFAKCARLEKVVFPESLKIIKHGAFQHCEALYSVTLNEGLKKVEPAVFEECKDMLEITFPETLRSVGARSFAKVEKVVLKGDIPHGFVYAIASLNWYGLDKYKNKKRPLSIDVKSNAWEVYVPRMIDIKQLADAECDLASDMEECMQTLYKYGFDGMTSRDTAYRTYMSLLAEGKEPCEELIRYIRRSGGSIVEYLIRCDMEREAIEFMKLGMLTKNAMKKAYDKAILYGKQDVAAYAMCGLEKSSMTSMRL